MFFVFNRVSIPIFTDKILELVDCALPEILRLLVYFVIWWKVYLWGVDIVIVLWKLSVVPVFFIIVCGIYCLLCFGYYGSQKEVKE